ncbi:MAG: signal peptidase II [Planctomycetota bacterium]
MSVALFFLLPLLALLALVPLVIVVRRRWPAAERWAILLSAFAVGLWLDIGSKELAFAHLPHDRDSIPVFSWFSWTHAENPGAAFGIFKNKHDFFMVVTLLAFVAVPYFVHVARSRVRLAALVFGLILAGVAGNFWDRMSGGVVRDFIDVHTPASGWLYDTSMRMFKTNIWPTFNVADIFITCGAAAALLFLGNTDQEEGEVKELEGAAPSEAQGAPGGAAPGGAAPGGAAPGGAAPDGAAPGGAAPGGAEPAPA